LSSFNSFEILFYSPGQPISLELRLNVAILNALWHIITGQTLEHDDPNLREVVTKVNIMMTGLPIGGPMFAFPWLKHIIPDKVFQLFNLKSCGNFKLELRIIMNINLHFIAIDWLYPCKKHV
jgi:hypothetical protein